MVGAEKLFCWFFLLLLTVFASKSINELRNLYKLSKFSYGKITHLNEFQHNYTLNRPIFLQKVRRMKCLITGIFYYL